MYGRHWGITVLAILGYIGAGLTLLFGLAIMFGSGALAGVFAQIPGLALLSSSLMIVASIVMLAFAVLDYFIARGLWNGKNWARILVIIFAALGILGSIWPFNIVTIIIDGLVILYLGFYKPAVDYFR